MTTDFPCQPALASAMPAPAAGYSLVLPPGWRRIPLRAGTDRAIRSVVREVLASAPRDAPADKVGPRRLELERRLIEMTADWLAAGLQTIDKPTHFEARDGRF